MARATRKKQKRFHLKPYCGTVVLLCVELVVPIKIVMLSLVCAF